MGGMWVCPNVCQGPAERQSIWGVYLLVTELCVLRTFGGVDFSL
eukprot:COSAG02_NODE_49185_length_328_cov_0.908297_1_plen_43_part_01